MRTSDLYKSSGIEINEDWITEIAKLNDEETQNQNNNTEHEDIQDQNDTDDDSDHFNEEDEKETHVGNTDTLLDYIPDDNPPCDASLIFAPGEGQRPISLYGDPDAEYLYIPTIFCGEKKFPLPPMKETVILEPLKENDDIEKYKAIYKEVQNEIDSLHNSEDIDQMTHDMFLDDVLQMNDENYIKAIRRSLSGPKVFLKRKPSEQSSALEKLGPDSTEIESDNDINRYSRRPKQLENWCLADYVSQLELQYPKTSESSDHETEQQENESESENEEENADVIEENNNKINIILKNGIRIYQRKTPKVIRYIKYNYKTDSENFYRERLMLFYPWRNELSDLQCGHETYEKRYFTVSRLLEKKAKQYEGKVIDLEKAIEEAEND
ncbi:unnamed protein product [Mytilus coruscus]|uniref:Uncharacterized protein n=1 Tax=Mytilus coruscus TaxID=42192 RepID=A0A6J8C3Y1_MYTCO|nr:unnamed protein product [Mytilus coruscus]